MANSLAAHLQPPAWVVDESVNRLVLFLNHVLQSEPEAMARLARQKGQRIELIWDRIQLQLTPTPAGLLERGRFDGERSRRESARDPRDVLDAPRERRSGGFRPAPVPRDPFFDKPYEAPTAEVPPVWESQRPAQRAGVSANIKTKRKVAALFKPGE